MTDVHTSNSERYHASTYLLYSSPSEPSHQNTSVPSQSFTSAVSSALGSLAQSQSGTSSSQTETTNQSTTKTPVPVIQGNGQSAHPKDNAPLIAGVAAGFGCLVFCIVTFFLYRRRVRGVEAGRGASSASNVEPVVPAWDGAPCTSIWGPAGISALALPSHRIHGCGKRLDVSPRTAATMDAPLQVDHSAYIQGATVTHVREDNLLATNMARVADSQEVALANQDEVEDTGESRASISPAMRWHIEALQMEMARLTSTVREVMLETEMGGPRGPPPAYEEDAVD